MSTSQVDLNTLPTPTADTKTFPRLTAHDRCCSPDCNAQAKARVVMQNGHDIVFCGHHMRELENVLVSKGGVITYQDDAA